MKERAQKRECPFEQGDGKVVPTSEKVYCPDVKSLSEMMNPANVNYFGCGLNDSTNF